MSLDAYINDLSLTETLTLPEACELVWDGPDSISDTYEEYHEYDEYEVDEAENECEVNADLDEESEITLSESQMVNTDVVVHED
jgi:hypothetical protein